MSLDQVPRRTYTTRHPEEDGSILVCTESSTSTASSPPSSAPGENSDPDIITDTSNKEIGKPLNKSDIKDGVQKPAKLGADSLSADEKKVAEFIEMLMNHSDPIKTKRELIEDFIRTNASDAFMRKMTKVANKEIKHLKGDEKLKWLFVFISGVLSQLTSFGMASEAALATKQAWLFPILSTILNEGLSDKVSALTRRTTYVTNDAKNLYRKQRLIARALGDMIRQCSGLEPIAKYRSNNPAHKGQKFTAWEALCKDTDSYFAVSTHNVINRGLPFLCFTGTYLARDAVLQNVLKGGAWWQTLALRLGAGALAGGLTALSNQLITRNNKDAKEIPGHSTSFWHAKEAFLLSVKQDIRERLNEAAGITDPHLKDKIEKLLLDLDEKIQREIDVAVLKKSTWSAIPGEIKASIQRSRAEDSLDPEAPGSLSQSIHNALGKFISLIYFTYMLDQSLNDPRKTESFSSYPTLNFLLLPFALIVMGFMWRDDAQIISRSLHGVGKGILDATVRRKDYKEKAATPLNQVAVPESQHEVVTRVPREINGSGNDAGNSLSVNDEIVDVTSDSESEMLVKTPVKEKLTAREIEAKDRKLARQAREKPSDARIATSKKMVESPLLISSSETNDDTDSEPEISTAKVSRQSPENKTAGKEYAGQNSEFARRAAKDKPQTGALTSAREEIARLMSTSDSSDNSDSESDDDSPSSSSEKVGGESSSASSTETHAASSSSSESTPPARRRGS